MASVSQFTLQKKIINKKESVTWQTAALEQSLR